jgi:hypothetical protein
MNEKKYKNFLKKTWYLNFLDFEYINNIKNNNNNNNNLQDRIDSYDFPIIHLLKIY